MCVVFRHPDLQPQPHNGIFMQTPRNKAVVFKQLRCRLL